MSNHIITGHTGEPHVTAVQQRRINAGISGSGRYILPMGGNLSCSYIGSNTVRITNGVARINGMDVGIDPGTYIDLAISNGTQGVARNDLVVIRYTRDQSTGIETADFVIVAGTPGAGDPSLAQGSLIDGTTLLDETALARVVVTGTTISNPVMLLPRGGPAKRLDDMATSVTSGQFNGPLNGNASSATTASSLNVQTRTGDHSVTFRAVGTATANDVAILVDDSTTKPVAMFHADTGVAEFYGDADGLAGGWDNSSVALFPGDTLAMSGTPLAGHLTTDRTQVECTIPLSRPVSTTVSAARVSFGQNAVNIRGIGGQIFNSAVADSRVTSVLVGRNMIRCTITGASAFSGTNNTPVSVRPSNINITFS